MTVGNQASESGLNATLGQVAVNIRNDLRQALNLFEYVNSIGTAGLQALGFSPADATAYFNTLNYLQTVAQVFFGTASQSPAFDFDNAVCEVYGGS